MSRRARIIYVNEAFEVAYCLIGPASQKIYGRRGNPLRLDLGEAEPRASCRIEYRGDGWFVENRGLAGLTWVNGEAVGSGRLGDWDELRCGELLMRFESGSEAGSTEMSQEIAQLRAALAAAAVQEQEAQATLRDGRRELVQLDRECTRLRQVAIATQHAQQDLLRRSETLQRQLTTEREQASVDGKQLQAQLAQTQLEAQSLHQSCEQEKQSARRYEARAIQAEREVKQLQARLSVPAEPTLVSAHERLLASHNADAQETEQLRHLLRLAEERCAAMSDELRGLRSAQAQSELERQHHSDEAQLISDLRWEAARARRDLEDCRSQHHSGQPGLQSASSSPEAAVARGRLTPVRESSQRLWRLLTDLAFQLQQPERTSRPRLPAAASHAEPPVSARPRSQGGEPLLEVLHAALAETEQLQRHLHVDE